LYVNGSVVYNKIEHKTLLRTVVLRKPLAQGIVALQYQTYPTIAMLMLETESRLGKAPKCSTAFRLTQFGDILLHITCW
jgi:hypothetical protein